MNFELRTSPNASTSCVLEDTCVIDNSLAEAVQLRQLVLPRPVSGLVDFGISLAPVEGEPDPALAVRFFPLSIHLYLQLMLYPL